MLDALALDEVLEATSSGGGGAPKAAAAAAAGQAPEGVDLGAAAAEYHRRQLPQAVALCSLLPVGFR
jgi:hypothetical protein